MTPLISPSQVNTLLVIICSCLSGHAEHDDNSLGEQEKKTIKTKFYIVHKSSLTLGGGSVNYT